MYRRITALFLFFFTTNAYHNINVSYLAMMDKGKLFHIRLLTVITHMK